MAATMTATQTERKTMYQQMDDIFDAITWGDLARTYFDKSASWFYNKMAYSISFQPAIERSIST